MSHATFGQTFPVKTWWRGPAWADIARLVRFGLTGLAGFTADFGTLVLCHGALGLELRISLLTAYTVGGCVHYGLTRLWVFPARYTGSEAGRVFRYLLLAGLNIAVTVSVVPALASAHVDYRIGKLLTVGGLFVVNYLLTSRFVMRVEPHPQPRLGA
jgi:putative flippase GtrA